MSKNQILLMTKHFIENKPSVRMALAELNEGLSLNISIEDRDEAHCFFANNQVQFREGFAQNADVLFIINAESIRRLSTLPCDTLAETGIEIVREILSGNIQIRMTSSVQNILTGGYLKIIKKAGPDFLNFLAEHGLKNMFKIIALIKKMRGQH